MQRREFETESDKRILIELRWPCRNIFDELYRYIHTDCFDYFDIRKNKQLSKLFKLMLCWDRNYKQ